jgi:hypothetical protein
MVFCRGCGKQIHDSALACPDCGASQAPVGSTASGPKPASSFEQKLHITMLVSAALAVALLYTTFAIWLISIASGVCLGLSWRLFVLHKRAGYHATRRSDWILLMVLAGIAFALILASEYTFQGLVLIVFGVRALIMYFSIHSPRRPAPSATPQ